MLRSRLSTLVVGLTLPIAACNGGSGDAGGGDSSGACGTSFGSIDAGDDGDDGGANPCAPQDSDGITGGSYAFDVTVDDTGFSPVILKAQNLGKVTLTLTNSGTRPHDFVVGCISQSVAGCPPVSCFPADASIGPLAPGATATATFDTPNPEGIYNFRSDVAGDSQLDSSECLSGLWGQFVVQ